MKTTILVEITHSKPLPQDLPITDVLSARAYGHLVNKGQMAEVSAKVWEEMDDAPSRKD